MCLLLCLGLWLTLLPQGLLPIMKKLLQAGAEIPTETQMGRGPNEHSWLDAVDEDIGCTAFHYAAVMGHRECTAALRRAGCSTEIQSRDGVEGLELAKMVCARAGRRGRTNMLARKVCPSLSFSVSVAHAVCFSICAVTAGQGGEAEQSGQRRESRSGGFVHG